MGLAQLVIEGLQIGGGQLEPLGWELADQQAAAQAEILRQALGDHGIAERPRECFGVALLHCTGLRHNPNRSSSKRGRAYGVGMLSGMGDKSRAGLSALRFSSPRQRNDSG